MYLRILPIQLCMLALLSCKNGDKEKSQDQSRKHDSIDTKNTLPEFEQKQDTLLLDSSVKISNKSRIEIVSVNKYIDSTPAYANSYKRHKQKCAEWDLNKENIKRILLTSTVIDTHELHYYYNVFPCYYTGKITIDGKLADFTINAGAFSIIEFRDTSIIIGYKKEDYKKYFLLGPGI